MAHPAFPEESSTILATPASFALLMSTAAPRSLYEPVGKSWSSFTCNSPGPRSTGTIGVIPSPNDTTLASSATGSASRYRHIVGFLRAISSLSKRAGYRTSSRPRQSHRHLGSFIGYVARQDVQSSPLTSEPSFTMDP